MRILLLILLMGGLLLGGLFGTGTALLFQWPIYFALGVAGVVSLAAWREKPRFAPADACLLAAGLFAGYVVLRALASPVDYLAREDLFLLLACVLVYGMTALVFTRSRERLAIFWLLVVVALINLGVGVVQYAGKPEFTLFPDYGRTYPAGRIGGQFNNPNHLGACLAFLSLLALGQAVFGRGGATMRMFLVFLTAMLLLGLGLTVSRGAFVGVVIGIAVLTLLAFYVLRQLYPKVLAKVGIALGLVMSVVLFAFIALNLSFIKQRLFQEEVFKESARMHFWKAALDQFASSPLTGTGSRTYDYLNRRHRPPELLHAEGEIEYVHNEYLQLLAEYGIIGMVLFIAAAALHLGNGVRFLRWFCVEKFGRTKYGPSTQVAFAAGAIAGMTALFVHAIFDFHFHIATVAMLAAFGLGVLANPGIEAAPGRRAWRPAALRGVWKAAMVAAGAAMVFFAFNYGRSELYLDRGKRYPGAQLSFENVSFFGRAKELDPGNPFIRLASADAWRRRVLEGMPPAVKQSFLEKAKEEYEAAYRLHPYDIYIILPLARCLDDLGLHEEAGEKFREALELAPLYYYARLEYAIHLHRLKRFDEAAEAYEAALEGHALREITPSMDRVRKLQWELERDRKAAGAREPSAAATP